MTAAIIRLTGAGRRYTGAGEQWAIRDCDVEIQRGDFVAITGPSGAGKSTLLNCLALLDRFDVGGYELDGRPVQRMRPSEVRDTRGRLFGFVFQASNMIPDRDVAKNVELPLASLGVAVSKRMGLVARALRSAKVSHRAANTVASLSGGERQRAAIARALVHEPAVLFLDEPTGNLDSANTRSVIELLRALNAAGTTIVMATHDPELAAAATRSIHVNDGCVSGGLAGMSRDAGGTTRGTAGGATTRVDGGVPESSVHTRRRRGAGGSLRRGLDAISEAVFSLYARPARTIIAVLSIGLGVAGLVGGVNLGETANGQVDRLITGTALNHVYVAEANGSGGNAKADFSGVNIRKIAALDAVHAVGDYDTVGAGTARVRRFEAEPATARAPVLGVSSGTFPALGISLAPHEARLFDLSGVDRSIAVVGVTAAKKLGLVRGADQAIWIDDSRFDVIGLVGGTSAAPDVARSVLISHDAVDALRIAGKHRFVVRTTPGRAAAVSDAIPYALDPGRPGHFTTDGTADVQHLRQGVSTSLNTLLLALAAVFLGIAILSTSSTMTNSVLQRTSEIGLRMATGAGPTAIAGLFLTEGGALGLLGGAFGSSIGVVTVVGVSLAQGWTPALDPTTILVGIGCGVGTGILAAIVPSVRASRIQPALAVRS